MFLNPRIDPRHASRSAPCGLRVLADRRGEVEYGMRDGRQALPIASVCLSAPSRPAAMSARLSA